MGVGGWNLAPSSTWQPFRYLKALEEYKEFGSLAQAQGSASLYQLSHISVCYIVGANVET